MSKTIVMFDDKDREINMSLYDFIDEQYRKAIPIIVCHVTEKEYDSMKKQIKSGSLNERLPRVKSEDLGYNKFRYVMVYDKLENNLLVSDYDNPKKIGSYRIDTDGIHYDENGYQLTNHPNSPKFFSYTVKVYTTESYEDIIAHYEAKSLLLQQKPDQNYEEIIAHCEKTKEIDKLIQQKTKELIELIGHHCKTCNTVCCGGWGDNNNCSRWSHTIS